jgi:hypothetical protein
MKTKLIIIALAAVTLLSFTVASTRKAVAAKSQNEANNTTTSGFALQDQDQF